jgi:hypothetical protein
LDWRDFPHLSWSCFRPSSLVDTIHLFWFLGFAWCGSRSHMAKLDPTYIPVAFILPLSSMHMTKLCVLKKVFSPAHHRSTYLSQSSLTWWWHEVRWLYGGSRVFSTCWCLGDGWMSSLDGWMDGCIAISSIAPSKFSRHHMGCLDTSMQSLMALRRV